MMDDRPNILLITTHDLGTHLRCYGWDPALPTPHLDRLAAEGVRFSNHFCTAPFCSPSRGSIITGKYPHVNGLMGLVNLGWDIPETNTFLPQLLTSAGYEAALFGFQHVAADPRRLGYEHIGERGNHGCRSVAPQAIAFLEQRAGGKPFFLEVGFSEVHRPYGGLEQIPVRAEDVQPLPFLEDTPGLRDDLAMFYENIRRMDAAVGSILETLARLELTRNTLVVFTTDHGIAFPRAKATLYDPGIRTALLMQWPEGMAGGRVVDAMVSNVDLFATLAELLQLPVPDGCNGESFLGVLRGDRTAARSTIFAEKNTAPDDLKRCLRTKTHKYIRNYSAGPKLFLPTDIEGTATCRDLGDAHLESRPSVELYDLANDPWEQENLAGRESHRDIVQELAGQLDQLLAETADPIVNGEVPRPPAEAVIIARIREPQAMQRRVEAEARIFSAYSELLDHE